MRLARTMNMLGARRSVRRGSATILRPNQLKVLAVSLRKGITRSRLVSSRLQEASLISSIAINFRINLRRRLQTPTHASPAIQPRYSSGLCNASGPKQRRVHKTFHSSPMMSKLTQPPSTNTSDRRDSSVEEPKANQ